MMGTGFLPVPVSAIVLAAGESRRMGSPKALLEFDGEKAIEKILGVCRAAGIEKPIVVLGAHADRIQKEAELCSAQVIFHSNWPKGQTSSVKAGVEHLDPKASWFLVWPVDLPLVPFEALHALLAASPESQRKKILVPTHRSRRGHPVRFATELAGEILALIDKQPLHDVLRRDPARVQEVAVESEAVLRDFDRPEDLK